jgi:hypothetical protein
MWTPTKAWLAVALALAFGQADPTVRYVDPQGRFEFRYPVSFGSPLPGTNNGFGDRIAAIRFSLPPPSPFRLGGEAALTRGFPLVDLQAAGGLYDAITLEVFPEPLRRTIAGTLLRLTPASFCREAVRPQHLNLADQAFASLTEREKTAIEQVDRMRNIESRMVRCVVDGQTVTFDKETSSEPGGPRQRIYGAIRFLDGDYSTFQVIRGGADAPDQLTLEQLTTLVNSWRPLP